MTAAFECPTCLNTRRWRNLSTGPRGTFADCGVCSTYVERPDLNSPIQINMAWTDSMSIGNGMTETNHF